MKYGEKDTFVPLVEQSEETEGKEADMIGVPASEVESLGTRLSQNLLAMTLESGENAQRFEGEVSVSVSPEEPGEEDMVGVPADSVENGALAKTRTLSSGYFEDVDKLTEYMRDQRASDTSRISTVSNANALVDAYISRGASSVWPYLNGHKVAQEIKDRCKNHRLFQQGNLNLCGPASFLMIWAGRDPVGYARYALGLLEHGMGNIGAKKIYATSALKAIKFPRLGGKNVVSAPAADFMAMSPLRHDANEILPYDPSSGLEGLAGATTPEEFAQWCRWTGSFSTVKEEANWMRIAGIDHALGLMVGSSMDCAMLINVNALVKARRVETIKNGVTTNPITPDNSFILSMFPNHYVVLLSELIPDQGRGTLSLSAWTWAGSYVFEDIPVREFSTNYYGAITTIMRRS